LARDFIIAFRAALEQVAAQEPVEASSFLRRLRDHFGADPAQLPVLTESFPHHDHPNLHLALEAYLAEPGRSGQLLGIATQHEHTEISLSRLVVPLRQGLWGGNELSEGPVKYTNFALEDDRVLPCLHSGLVFIADGAERLAVLVRGPRERGWGDQTVDLQVMATDQERAATFLTALRTAVRERSVYRSRVISVEAAGSGPGLDLTIKFHHLPAVDRQGIILPAVLLERIERQTIGFAQRSERLRAAGRHLKRGLLLYGPPGTGKTLTAMYLAARMPERTVLLLTGCDVGLIEQSCALARLLQPATVVLEDVDLIAQERTQQATGTNTVLFELLNQMDGLADDADILFLLTSNRPELLEPALAARPGRIDQAIEVPLPDADCRRRLITLYGGGLELRLTDLDGLIARTDGVSAAFMRELLRRAALFAADEGDLLVVEDRHLEEALHELVVEGGPLTRSLLGASQSMPALTGHAQ
jgi:hypothetical protein